MGHDRRLTKRAVNLGLNDGLVQEALGLTADLSETGVALLAAFIDAKKKTRASADAQVAALIAASNQFLATHGGFGDAFSTL